YQITIRCRFNAVRLSLVLWQGHTLWILDPQLPFEPREALDLGASRRGDPMKSPLKLFGVTIAAAAAGVLAASVGAAAVPAQADQAIDFQTLDAIVGDARTVVFGEDSHEMAAIH